LLAATLALRLSAADKRRTREGTGSKTTSLLKRVVLGLDGQEGGRGQRRSGDASEGRGERRNERSNLRMSKLKKEETEQIQEIYILLYV